MNKEMKFKMTFDEMAEAFAEDNPGFKPNWCNVGRYAKAHGYTRCRQMENREISRFYLKIQKA